MLFWPERDIEQVVEWCQRVDAYQCLYTDKCCTCTDGVFINQFGCMGYQVEGENRDYVIWTKQINPLTH